MKGDVSAVSGDARRISPPCGIGKTVSGSKLHTNLARIKIEVLDNVRLQSFHGTRARLLRCIDERGMGIIEVLGEG